MSKEDILQNADELKVPKKSLNKMQRITAKEKMLYPLIGALTVMLSAFAGRVMGKDASFGTYPFQRFQFCCGGGLLAIGGATFFGLMKNMKEDRRVLFMFFVFVITIILSAITFLFSYEAAEPTFSEAVEYGVFHKYEKNG